MPLLPLLIVGCRLFSSAAIDETCEDFKACGDAPGPGPDDTAPPVDDTDEPDDTDDTDEPDPDPEDCDDGIDNDLDGNTDCEDDECLDQCLEDCDDGIDNDLDGDADCADDECYGVDGCGGPYDLELTTYLNRVRFLWGDLVASYGYDSDAEMQAYGTLYLTAAPSGWGGEGFTCSAWLYLSTVGASNIGVRFADAQPDDAIPYSFTLYPNVADYSLDWYGDCPLGALPEWDWGFRRRKDYFFVEHGAGWELQYQPSTHYWYDGSYRTTEYFLGAYQLYPLSLHLPYP